MARTPKEEVTDWLVAAEALYEATERSGLIPDSNPPYTALLHRIADQKDIILGLERTIRSQAGAMRKMERELEQFTGKKAREHPSYPAIKALHDHWRDVCNHPRSKFGPDEFWMALPRFEAYGELMCRRAIDGAAYDPYVTTRRNGTKKRHDGWDVIFDRGNSKFEEFCCRAPREAA